MDKKINGVLILKNVLIGCIIKVTTV